jgi:hypothetical protein
MIILKITAEDNQNRKKKKTATRLARQSKKNNSGKRFPLPRGESFFFMASTFLCRNMVC